MNELWNLLKEHAGHRVEIAVYGDPEDPESICLEDMDTNTVILDAELYTICVDEEPNPNIIRSRFPEGTRIVLDHMVDDPRPIPDGTRGIVQRVDDIGTVHCSFENGRHLGLVPGVNRFHKIAAN